MTHEDATNGGIVYTADRKAGNTGEFVGSKIVSPTFDFVGKTDPMHVNISHSYTTSYLL